MNDIKTLKVVIASSRKWCTQIVRALEIELPGCEIRVISTKDELTHEALSAFSPSYVFFPYWSYLIPEEIYENFNCVIFHMTDLPFGRGGSPLQNLISRGIFDTKISAIRCVKELDSGPVYLKRPLSLYGNAEEIYLRAAKIIEGMIRDILATDPTPQEQRGEIVEFSRRKSAQSDIHDITELEKLFHHIRMLDADGYPHAYFETNSFRFEFSRASLRDGCIVADVKIKEKTE